MEYDENELKMVIGSCEIGYEEQLYEFIYKLFMGKLNALAQWCLKIAQCENKKLLGLRQKQRRLQPKATLLLKVRVPILPKGG